MSTHNLPSQPTSFVGRTQEIAEVLALLAAPSCRLLTLVGPGGIGKTRLAIEVTSRCNYPDGVYFVALQPLSSPAYIVSAIADAIHFQFYTGHNPKQELLNYLRRKRMLLVLDNYEHLLEDISIVSDLLAHTTDLKIILTSRERLNVSGETVYGVGGMRIPQLEDTGNILNFSAVKLFVQNARRVRPNLSLEADDFKYLSHICRLVGGMPLAILLAAAWIEVLSLPEIAAEIERNLEFLESEMRDLPERHRSIRATFDYSWKRLTDNERDMFKKLAVFRGGFTREAAQAIGDISLKTLMGLVNKSLVQVADSGRFDVHELMRQYAQEKLSESPLEFEQVKAAHAAHYAAFCAQRGDELRGAKEDSALALIDIELDNIRMGWEWAVQHHALELIWQFLFAIWTFYESQCRYHEASLLFGHTLERLRADSNPKDYLVFTLLVFHEFIHGIFLQAHQPQQQQHSEAILSYLEDYSAIRRETALALVYMGFLLAQSDLWPEHRSVSQLSISICRQNNYLFELATAFRYINYVHTNHWTDEYATQLEPMMQELLDIAHKTGNLSLIIEYKAYQGLKLYYDRDYANALPVIQDVYLQVHGIAKFTTRLFLADSLTFMGEYDEAKHHCVEIFSLLKGTDLRKKLDLVLTIAGIQAATGDVIGAVALAAISLKDPFTRGFSQELLIRLEAQLSPQAFAQAIEYGRTLDIEAAIEEVITSWGPTASNPPRNEARTMIEGLLAPLTERELEVLRLVAAGQSNREIAKELVLALGTVKWYISEVYSKLGVSSRTQAIARANELKLLP